MKNLLTSLFVLGAMTAVAQPDAGLVVESVEITEPALTDITTDLGATPYTWRISANIPDDYEVQIVYGNFESPLSITTTGSYYQDPLGGGITTAFSQAQVDANPTLAYDSWLTIGATESTSNMIMLVPDEVLDGWEAGDNVLINDFIGGSVFITTEGFNEQNTPDANGNVLLAQITATENVDVCLSFQIRRLNPDGSIYTPTETWQYTNQCVSLSTGGAVGCPGDFDGSGTVTIPDVLILLTDFGCQSGCIADMTGDDKTLTDDFLEFLSVFGTTCD